MHDKKNSAKTQDNQNSLVVKCQKTDILGIAITSRPIKEILEYAIKHLNTKTRKWYVVTPNPEMIVYAKVHSELKTILNEAEISLPDGVGLVWAAKILNRPLNSRITGVDFMEKLCEQLAKIPVTVGFLGGVKGVAEETSECLKRKYPGLKVVWTGSNWGERSLKSKHIDFLFVAFGFPKQEIWIREHLASIPVTAAMGVGGSFDYISGKVIRAPVFLRAAGLEWLYRLFRQPWRWRRQTALLPFIFLVMQEFIKNRFALQKIISPVKQ